VSTHFAAQRLSACEFMNKLAIRLAMGVISLLLIAPGTFAQDHAQPTKPGQVDAPPTEYESAQHPEDHGEHGLSALLWPTVNFAILAGGLWWFFKEPVGVYLRDRHDAIRKDLVAAAGAKAAAAEQIAEIERKLQALPGELDALKRRGAEEIAADEQRIATIAAAERERLLEQTRREIDLQVRVAKRELVEHAADLSLSIASERIQKSITPADQERLVDRYLQLLSENSERANSGRQGAR
jgi:F-type H+-transporting ATPase subunit b